LNNTAAARIKLLMIDVDGVLTDGGVYFASDGSRMLRFDAKDGMGISLLRRAGVICAIVSCGSNPAVEHRAEVLGIEHVVLGCPDDGKGRAVRELLQKLGISPEEAAFIGDDVTDLAAFEQVGLRIAVGDAVRQVQDAADWVTQADGGHGAVREVADAILEARGMQF